MQLWIVTKCILPFKIHSGNFASRIGIFRWLASFIWHSNIKIIIWLCGKFNCLTNGLTNCLTKIDFGKVQWFIFRWLKSFYWLTLNSIIDMLFYLCVLSSWHILHFDRNSKVLFEIQKYCSRIIHVWYFKFQLSLDYTSHFSPLLLPV